MKRMRNEYGPCPKCGNMFQSKAKKTYCSMNCYVNSEEFRERLKAQREAILENQRKINPSAGMPKICPNCGKEFKGSNSKVKYCSNLCRRKYFSERFDRYIANPETVALPQNYDEFFDRIILSCPVDGCSWMGEQLGNHVNFTHGITADQFRVMCGCNKNTGLIGTELFKFCSENGKKNGVPFLVPNRKGCTMPRSRLSLEAKEHQKKTRALFPENSGKYLPCRECGTQIEQPCAGRKWFCRVECRSKFDKKKKTSLEHEVVCAFCEKTFMGNVNQKRRASRGFPVCCSMECRNKYNIKKALSARGLGFVNVKEGVS